MDVRWSMLGVALAARHGPAQPALRWLACCGEQLAKRARACCAAIATTAHAASRKAAVWANSSRQRLASALADGRRAAGSMAREGCRRAPAWADSRRQHLARAVHEAGRAAGPMATNAYLAVYKSLAWCRQRLAIYVRAWRNTMAAMSVYEDMMRQPGAGKVRTEASRKALAELGRDC